MTFLSRIRLNPQRANARRFLANPQAMHAAVLGGLPRQPVDERVLWRVDPDDPHRPFLWVLTQTAPSWEHLVEQAGWPSADDPDDPQVAVRAYEPLLARLADGDEYAFRLTANPVSSTKRADRLTPAQLSRLGASGQQRSFRVPHITIAHQVEWLVSRAPRLGFVIPPATSSEAMNEDVPDARVSSRARRSFSKRGSSGRVSLHVATFEGRLVVSDSEALARALVEGIGKAKAYGCGLMTLAPLPEAPSS